MTKEEFDKKLSSYKTSSASYEVKRDAIAKLEQQFYGVEKRNETLLKEIEAGKADTDDMGGN